MRKLIFFIILLFVSNSLLNAQVRIKMQRENGVYMTPCLVNGLRLRFIFDTGASNVSISLSEAAFMLKNGYLQESDIIGSSRSQIANGDIVENTKVNLKVLEIGGLKVYNVEAVIIHDLSAPLLLGQSAIEKLGKIQLENNELVIMDVNSSGPNANCIAAKVLIEEAKKYYFNNLYTLSADTYQKAYNLCPDSVDCWNIYLMGNAYYRIDSYELCLKYLGKAAYCSNDKETLYWVYYNMGIANREINDFYNALVCLEKSLLYTKDDQDIATSYSSMAVVKFYENKYNEAITFFEESTKSRLNYLSVTIEDVMRGDVSDQDLGESIWNARICYEKLGTYKNTDSFAAASALCGYQEAIGYCNKYGINYKNFTKK